MDVTRRNLLAAAPAGAALATLLPSEPSAAAGITPAASTAGNSHAPAGWLVALRSSLAPRSTP